jgi:RNA polymerase sigma factor (sigma-70 family)
MLVTTDRAAQLSALYTQHQPTLHRRVRALVSTTRENVEDACMFAWAQLLQHQLEQPDAVSSWLLTVAKREAIKLEIRSRAAELLHGEFASALEPADPRDHIAARTLTLDAAAAITAAGLTDGQTKLVGLRAAGFSYQEIATATSLTVRTVERQLLRADGKLREARTASGGGDTPAEGSHGA